MVTQARTQSQPAPTESAPTETSPAPSPAQVTESRGGGNYVIQRGDTLSSIARATYGYARYWRDIARANPTKVFRNGDLILTGDEIVLPVVDVPVVETDPGGDPGPGTTPGAEEPVVDLPEEPAIEPAGRCTEFGDFLVYPDDYLGPLPPRGADGVEHVYASQVDGIVAERRAAAEAERQAAVTEVDDLLSRGVFDWAVTDGEATQALARLGNLHFTQIGPAIAAIGQDKVTTLLDNLPDDQFGTPAFTKIVVALGPGGAQPFLQALMSYGVFDWAVTDGDVNAVMRVVNAAPPEQQAAFILGMDQKFQVRFAENLHPGATISQALLKQLFDAMPDDQLGALQNLLGTRFGFEVGGREGGAWTAEGLRQAWVLLEQLPPGHVQNNEELDMFLQGGSTDGSGYYRGSDDSAVLEYGDITATGGYGQILVDDGTGNRVDVGLHSNVNLFNTVVRHEIGHAVDAKINASGPGGYAQTAANAGRWSVFEDRSAFADAIIAAGGGMGGHGYPDEAAYEQALRKAVEDEVDFNTALADLQGGILGSGIGADVDAGVTPADASVAGPVAAVFDLNRWHSSKNPWYSPADRSTVGGRVFQMAYSGSRFCSYDWTARQSFGVSAYQFRAPGEWFAEAYACYYSDHDSVTNNQPGTRLRSRDPQTADWFDASVDQGHSLAEEAPASTGGGGGGGGGSSAPRT